MKKICIVTSTRAEYGLLSRLIRAVNEDKAFVLQLVVTGTHLSYKFGYTKSEILADGYRIDAEIDILCDDAGECDSADIFSRAISGFSATFKQLQPDLVVLLGDRYEIMAVANVCLLRQIPIAHLCGGDTTFGAIDEACRHCITKVSSLHFTGNSDMRHRVVQLGEKPSVVYDVGEPGVENMIKTETMTVEELSRALTYELVGHDYAIVTFHSVTTEKGFELVQLEEMLKAFLQFPTMKFIITSANCDDGGECINARIAKFVVGKENMLFVDSLGMKKYLSALKGAKMVIGNSSSGIIEAPIFHIPTINIGNRQQGRMQAESIINCLPDKADIVRAMTKAMTAEFANVAKNCKQLYGDGNTTELIMSHLKQAFSDGAIDCKKIFHDVNFIEKE